MRRATVQLEARGVVRSTSTDAGGYYEFVELPAGRYTVRADKAGFVSMAYGERQPQSGGRLLTVRDGQQLTRVDVSLRRGGAIAGRVLDEFGEPVSDATVAVHRQARGVADLRPAARTDRTDDMGEFRIYGLAEGNYFVSASAAAPLPSIEPQRNGLAPTYFPGVSDAGQAQPLHVRLGETLSEVVIPMVPSRLSRVSGTVVDAGGRPIRSGMVVAIAPHMPSMFTPTRPGQIRSDGSFQVDGVPPGQYILRATDGPATLNRTNGDPIAVVTVTGDELTGLTLAPARPIRVSGTVLLTGTPPEPGALERVVVQLQPDGINASFGPSLLQLVSPRADGFFELSSFPGRYLMRARGGHSTGTEPGAPTWQLRSVRFRGEDVTDTGFDLWTLTEVSGVEVELTNVRTEVLGGVADEKGNRLTDFAVVIFPRDRERWTPSSRFIAVLEPDDSGRFRTNSLPPNVYEAVALERADPNRAREPEFLEGLRGTGTTFTLGEGGTQALELRLSEIAAPY